jgi:general secretion pathway protein D
VAGPAGPERRQATAHPAAPTSRSSGGNIIEHQHGSAAGARSTCPAKGLNIGLLRNSTASPTLAAIARMLQTPDETNIVSTPNLITLDNEEAKIVVGENVPFITGQFTNTGTTATNPFQTIERKDVGITLRIRRRSAKAARCA